MRKVTLSPFFEAEKRRDDCRITLKGKTSVPFLLIISASPPTRATLASWLSQEGMAVSVCADAVAALRSLVRPDAHIPDLVLLDHEVAMSSGYGLIRTLKTLPQCAQTRVVVLSRFDGMVERLFSRLAGADDYLIKPISERVLLEVIAMHLDMTLARKAPGNPACGTIGKAH